VNLYKTEPRTPLKEILTKAFGILVVVDKQREIYFIDNIKFHIDTVKDLGTFIEIEAIDTDGNIGIDKLTQQCEYYLNLFEIKQQDLVSTSYSDLLLQCCCSEGAL
jgi:predicted adenylyl cyclase CyaB